MIVVLLASAELRSQTNGFLQAYDTMHRTFSRCYPFNEWKAIRWNEVNSRIRPMIQNASLAGDSAGFYIALKSYYDCTHDGHVGFRHGWQHVQDEARYRQIGGSYGFALTHFDDGRDVARLVNPGSPAYLAGMRFGATILEVNDRSVMSVLDTVQVLWSEMIPATLEFRKISQGRMIGRAAAGHTMKVKFVNRDSSNEVTATLTAVDDNYLTYNQTSMHPVEPALGVFSKVLQPSGYGYIKMNYEAGDSVQIRTDYLKFKNALAGFNQQGVKGVVLDFRVNSGGNDGLAAALAGLFHTDTVLYEIQTWYNVNTGSIEIMPVYVDHFDPQSLKLVKRPNYPQGYLYSEPQGFYYDKPVVVMVNPRSISSGEGVPMMLKKLQRAEVVSFYGSNGSFGMVDWSIYFFPSPDSLHVTFPFGQSVDKNLRVQLDSDSLMNGGVTPTIRVPLNDTVLDQLYIDSIDVELNYAVKTLNSMLGIGEPASDTFSGIGLGQNIPNPFKGITSITYSLSSETFALLEFCDLNGKVLQTLVSSQEKTGTHVVKFDGTAYAPGMYLFRLKAGGVAVIRKCVII